MHYFHQSWKYDGCAQSLYVLIVIGNFFGLELNLPNIVKHTLNKEVVTGRG